jgi:predicted phage terminase large subunit-like protein
MKLAAIHRSISKSLLASDDGRGTGGDRLLMPDGVDWRAMPPALMPYQQRWVSDDSPIKICEKSRRVGLTWAEACDCVLDAASAGGRSVIYVSYNFDMTENFIRDCEFWAKAFKLAASEVEEVMLEDEQILAYQIRFSSGNTIKALSGKPNNIRGKQARVVIDEAAFCDNLAGLVKAAIALLMWGGRISIISSHNGVDNPFNLLIEAVKAGELTYSRHRITLDDALIDGLYERICLTQGQKWSPDAEDEWRSQLYRDYGIDAEEELDCIPFKARPGGVFNRDWFEVVDSIPNGGTECRFWDMAATAQEQNSEACLTSGVRMKRIGNIYYIGHVDAERLGPAEGDDRIVSCAQQDGRFCMVRWEKEGGSAGPKVDAYLKARLAGFNATGIKPLGDKLLRAKPFASECKRGNVKVLRADWTDQYLDWLHAFDGLSGKGKINDPIDASSGAYSVLKETIDRVEFATTGRKRIASQMKGY